MKNILNRLDADKSACFAQAADLARDGRGDDSDLAKIRANIYGIVEAVCRAADCQGDAAAFVRGKIESISQVWAQSLTVAEQHGDHVKAAIERVKIDTIGEIFDWLGEALEARNDRQC